MRNTPETDDQPTINAINDYGYAVPCVDIEYARKLERERDEAREALKYIEEYGTEEINAAVELRQKLASALVERDEAITRRMETIMQCELYEQERDKAREDLEEEKKFHHRTHGELVQTQCKVLDLTQAIIATLEENRHLADGDDCTLAKLKSVVPEWK